MIIPLFGNRRLVLMAQIVEVTNNGTGANWFCNPGAPECDQRMRNDAVDLAIDSWRAAHGLEPFHSQRGYGVHP